MPQTALKFETEVTAPGRIEIDAPLPPGSHVIAFAIEESPETFGDLTAASSASLDFWNNAHDDEEWNEA